MMRSMLRAMAARSSHASGVTNGADPTEWTRYTMTFGSYPHRVFGWSRPQPIVEIDLTGFWCVVARVRVLHHEVLFCSPVVHARLHRLFVRLYEACEEEHLPLPLDIANEDEMQASYDYDRYYGRNA